MEKRNLKQTDLEVSRLCFGTMTFGGQADEAVSQRLVDCCIDAGINFFDTANVYNQGRSEEILGKALGNRRRNIVLASKVRGAMGESPEDKGLSRAAIHKAIDASLKRLGTDYLDIYYLHQPDYDVAIEETLEAMDGLVRAGKVRYPAASNYAAWQMADMMWIARQKGYRAATIAQPMYNLLARGIEQEFLPMAERFGVSSVVYNPLAGGLLTGKHQQEQPLVGSRFDRNQMYLDRYWHPAYFTAVEELRRIADKAGRSLVSLSLNWILHHTRADCVILGASKPQQLEENLKTADEGALTADAVAECDAVWAALRGITPKYNR
ncbi:MAG: aldo/keto reductase [Acidobacteriaceae bacterium]|nr:aldo/keto reductase [Acidobacteriaceae bacterium]